MKPVFKTRYFSRLQAKIGLADKALYEAILEIEEGLVDAHLGGAVIKKRVGLAGRGKRGGLRVIVATTTRDQYFYLYLFKKSQRDDISEVELTGLQKLAGVLSNLTESDLRKALESGEIQRVFHEN